MGSPSDEHGRLLRLLILTDTSITGSGGSERVLRNLIANLPREHYQVTLVQLCPKPEGGTELYQAGASLTHNEYLPLSAVYKPDGMRAFGQLRRMVLREGFDIIQSQHESSDVFNALLPRGPKHAMRISNRRDMGFLKSTRLRWLSRLLNHRFDRILAPSEAILDAVERTEGASRACMRCIPNGVDTDRFRPADVATRATVRAGIGCAASDLLVGCVANLNPVKRHSDLIDAFAEIYAAVPEARLILVGEGPLRRELEARIHAHGLDDVVRLLGSRSDVDQLLPALDLFVLASSSEGLSNAVLEAQSCGLPIVATRVGGNPELVPASCGELVAAKQPSDLAASLSKLLRDSALRARMGNAARQHVIEQHSLGAMARAYASLYRELVDAR